MAMSAYMKMLVNAALIDARTRPVCVRFYHIIQSGVAGCLVPQDLGSDCSILSSTPCDLAKSHCGHHCLDRDIVSSESSSCS